MSSLSHQASKLLLPIQQLLRRLYARFAAGINTPPSLYPLDDDELEALNDSLRKEEYQRKLRGGQP